MGYKLYRKLENEIYSERQGECKPLLRIDTPEYDTLEEATAYIVKFCLNSDCTLEEIKIMEEKSIDLAGFVLGMSKGDF